MPTGPQPYGEFFIRQGAKTLYGIDWEPWLENRWRYGALHSLSDVVRPSAPIGLEFLCTVAGQSGLAEPLWPTAVNRAVIDGGVTWVSQPCSNAGLTSTVQSAVWTPPANITVTGATVAGQVTSALIDATAATAGTDYLVVVTATMVDGEVQPGQIKFKAR